MECNTLCASSMACQIETNLALLARPHWWSAQKSSGHREARKAEYINKSLAQVYSRETLKEKVFLDGASLPGRPEGSHKVSVLFSPRPPVCSPQQDSMPLHLMVLRHRSQCLLRSWSTKDGPLSPLSLSLFVALLTQHTHTLPRLWRARPCP